MKRPPHFLGAAVFLCTGTHKEVRCFLRVFIRYFSYTLLYAPSLLSKLFYGILESNLSKNP